VSADIVRGLWPECKSNAFVTDGSAELGWDCKARGRRRLEAAVLAARWALKRRSLMAQLWKLLDAGPKSDMGKRELKPRLKPEFLLFPPLQRKADGC
jgi:hypothetical protein